MKITIDEYSKHYKMSKEMIHSKIKDRKLNHLVENGITYIIVTKNNINKNTQTVNPPAPIVNKPKVTVSTILSLYQKENQYLKDKIQQLEDKIDKLISEKEQMLRDERDKIEEVYSAKDEQLKNILELMNTKLSLEKKPQLVHEVQALEKEPSVEVKKDDNFVELKNYLKTLELKSYQKKVIRKRFLAVHNSDIRVIQQNGKIYLDLGKYDYSDLLSY